MVLCTMLVNTEVQNETPDWLLNVILDSVGTDTIINLKSLTKGCVYKVKPKLIQ